MKLLESNHWKNIYERLLLGPNHIHHGHHSYANVVNTKMVITQPILELLT